MADERRTTTSQYAVVLGLPLHLVDAAQTEIVRLCAVAPDDASTKGLRKALRRLQLDSYEQGKERGEADATVRLRTQLADVGGAYLEAFGRTVAGPDGVRVLPYPASAAVLTALHRRGVVATSADVRRLCRIAGLPLDDDGDDAG